VPSHYHPTRHHSQPLFFLFQFQKSDITFQEIFRQHQGADVTSHDLESRAVFILVAIAVLVEYYGFAVILAE